MRREFYPSPKEFFDLDRFPYPELFNVLEVWGVLLWLTPLVSEWLDSRRVPRVTSIQRAFWNLQRVHVGSQVSIGEGTMIYPGAYIGDLVVIGKNCRIGQNAVLKGPLVLADDCVVGPGGEVGHSVFFPGARAAHKNFVGNSLIGANVNLGAGSETANWKLDGSEIGLWVGKKRYQTGLTKFGAVIGDGSSIGGNSVFQPGALLGKNCRVGPLVVVPNQYFADGTVLKKTA